PTSPPNPDTPSLHDALPISKEPDMPADLLLYNAKVATNGIPSFVEAVAVEGDKIVATGTNDEILRLRGPRTTVIDVQGRTVIPGDRKSTRLNSSHQIISYAV